MIKNVIPNFITVLNLFVGIIAIVYAFENQIHIASYLIIIASVLDFLDGFFARILNAKSEMGKMLDSLADIVSFGVLPAVILYQMMVMSLTLNDASFNLESADFFEKTILYLSFLISIFAALRLGRFMTETGDSTIFKGLPVPAMSLFVSGYFLSIYHTGNQLMREFFLRTDVLLTIIVFLSILMVSNIRMFSLKFTDYSFKKNKLRYLFILISFLALLIYSFYALPYIIVAYIFISIMMQILIPVKTQG